MVSRSQRQSRRSQRHDCTERRPRRIHVDSSVAGASPHRFQSLPLWPEHWPEPNAKKSASTARPSARKRVASPGLHQPEIPPMPTRLPPYVLESRHEVSGEFDVDWTLCPENWPLEMERRELRNNMIKEQLQKGRNVAYISSGWSLWPRVLSNDRCTYEPVESEDQVRQDDIVFCQVQPGDRFYAHLVTTKSWYHEELRWAFTILN